MNFSASWKNTHEKFSSSNSCIILQADHRQAQQIHSRQTGTIFWQRHYFRTREDPLHLLPPHLILRCFVVFWFCFDSSYLGEAMCVLCYVRWKRWKKTNTNSRQGKRVSLWGVELTGHVDMAPLGHPVRTAASHTPVSSDTKSRSSRKLAWPLLP